MVHEVIGQRQGVLITLKRNILGDFEGRLFRSRAKRVVIGYSAVVDNIRKVSIPLL